MIQIRNIAVSVAPHDVNATGGESGAGNGQLADMPPYENVRGVKLPSADDVTSALNQHRDPAVMRHDSALAAATISATAASVFAHLGTPAIAQRLDFFKPDPPPIISESPQARVKPIVDTIKDAKRDAAAAAQPSLIDAIVQAAKDATATAQPSLIDAIVQAAQDATATAEPSLIDAIVQAVKNATASAQPSFIDAIVQAAQDATATAQPSFIDAIVEAEKDVTATVQSLPDRAAVAANAEKKLVNAVPTPRFARPRDIDS